MDQVIPNQFNGFSRIEYLSVFVALLYGFVVAEFFLGWSKMFRKREQILFSYEHIAWTTIFFFVIVLNYYTMWFRISYLEMGFFYYLLVFVPILIFYFAAIYLFPEFDGITELDLKSYFIKSNKSIIALMSLYFTLNLIISTVFHENDVFATVNIIRFLYVVFGIAAYLHNVLWLRLVLLAYMSVALIVALVVASGS